MKRKRDPVPNSYLNAQFHLSIAIPRNEALRPQALFLILFYSFWKGYLCKLINIEPFKSSYRWIFLLQKTLGNEILFPKFRNCFNLSGIQSNIFVPPKTKGINFPMLWKVTEHNWIQIVIVNKVFRTDVIPAKQLVRCPWLVNIRNCLINCELRLTHNLFLWKWSNLKSIIVFYRFPLGSEFQRPKIELCPRFFQLSCWDIFHSRWNIFSASASVSFALEHKPCNLENFFVLRLPGVCISFKTTAASPFSLSNIVPRKFGNFKEGAAIRTSTTFGR